MAENITYKDWLTVDLRVVTITNAQEVEGADKLLHFTIDAGEMGTHSVASAVKEWYTPEDLIGKQAVWLSNLPPRTMRGIESEGMLLFANDGEKYVPLSLAADVPNGTRAE